MDTITLRFDAACVVGPGYPDAYPGAVVELPATVAGYFVRRGLATEAPAADPAPLENRAVKPRARR